MLLIDAEKEGEEELWLKRLGEEVEGEKAAGRGEGVDASKPELCAESGVAM